MEEGIHKNPNRCHHVTEAPARYRAWTSHYPGERATDYTTGTSRGHQRVSPEGEPCVIILNKDNFDTATTSDTSWANARVKLHSQAQIKLSLHIDI